MVRNSHAESMMTEEERPREAAAGASEFRGLRTAAAELGSHLGWLPGTPSSSAFSQRWRRLKSALAPVLARTDAAFALAPSADDLRWLRDNLQLVYAESRSVVEELKPLKRLPHVRGRKDEIVPRVLALAQAFLDATANRFTEAEFAAFCQAFQRIAVLDFREVSALAPALKLVLLERIAARGRRAVNDPTGGSQGLGICIRSLRDVTRTSWKDVLEPLILFDEILRQDPAGYYSAMDFESRDQYREELSKIAQHSDLTEMEVAREVLKLARQAQSEAHRDPRMGLRKSHIGYYLVAEGSSVLFRKIGFKPGFGESLRTVLRRHPDEFFLPGIVLLTFVIITGILLLLTPNNGSPELVLFSMLILLLPSSQAAVQLMNHLVTALLPARILPKLDFSEGVPADCVTLVAIPTLLLNEKQVRGLVEDLEVRFLGNHDPNIHFALVSDLPDSDHAATEENPLIDLCGSLIRQLNAQHGRQNAGSFFLFHRHRIYNPREKGWMGWERKRGKLLDLNKLMRGQCGSFPVKVGDLSLLPKVRFVITLDSDTELPRGSAQRMIGTLAHPLNQAIVDPEKNIVVAGYGVLQPRVGVSVQSTARSRLAAIYAGETRIDIYTHAVSDAYQDLYGEGSFAGKGIYEVDSVQRVLDRRFPRNALLSHDLIEGAYARAGLASDIEVIEDYPSHYSAYNRRKHRWLRGDWQIIEWLTSRVPDESGARVPNPISLVSRWKILDNLRRSLVEPATFVLLLFGWLVPGGKPLLWTFATICILFISSCFELALGLIRGAVERDPLQIPEAVSTFYAAAFTVFLSLVFLAHQTLLSLDAVIRALVRRTFTRERLLEWQTAEEAEVGTQRTSIDRYLDAMPFLAVTVGAVVWLVKPQALPSAIPVLMLWASSKVVAVWLNQSPRASASEISPADKLYLRRSALHIWRYFAEFCTTEHNWLIPDNVQEEPPAIAARISPTNLGLLLNARQVAVELGYLTVPEFAEWTRRTMETVSRLGKYRGHLLNWYDTRTLEPLAPRFVSSVDSGNLLASLWSLQQGCATRLRQPLLEPSLAEGLLDYLRILAEHRAFPRKELSRYETQLRDAASADVESRENFWLDLILNFPVTLFDETKRSAKAADSAEILWFRREAQLQVDRIRRMVRLFAPWCLGEFASLRNDSAISTKLMSNVPLQQLPDLISELEVHLERLSSSAPEENRSLYERLKPMLTEARGNAIRLVDSLRESSTRAGELANGMDFRFLLNEHRQLMSVGFDLQAQQLQAACYDLLATESRTAVFVAIAKEDIPQDCWFRLGRGHTLDRGRPVLLSWSGTMFEYQMPALWMRSYPNTLLARARLAAVRSQQAYAANRGVPWGISESAYFKLDELGNYQYQAFGLPQLSLMRRDSNPLVISPYSTFLSLDADRDGALRNLRRMEALGWFGPYGFYEAADYSAPRPRLRGSRCQLVRCWMAHHQGMSLLAVTNLLCDSVVQRWFHSDRRVQATELLLQEKPVAHMQASEKPYGTAAK